jgi:5-methylthioadenosine/S-adenosylhomocysteine deaminase
MDAPSTDCVLIPRWVIPIEPYGCVLEQSAVVVQGGRIAFVGDRGDALAQYPAAAQVALPQHALMPGFINLHTHAAMALFRGMADDMPLMRWLQERVWPAEAKFADAAFVRDGTLLAAAEMLRGGVTCFNDMYFFPEAAAQAASRLGMRCALGIVVIEFPTRYAADPDDYLAKGLALRDEMRGNPLVSFCFAPHAPYTVSDASFRHVATLAEQLQLPIHVHLHETANEIDASVEKFGLRPIERLRRLGVIGPSTIAVHAVHLDPTDIATLAEHGCSVAHCPSSNMKLASGIAPVATLVERGINVGLGTDGAASNNRLDMLGEMRTAALLAKVASARAEAVPAYAALRMATLNAAQAMGLSSEVGSIEVGKAADLCAIEFNDLGMNPVFDPASHIVYCAGREQVSDVWVAGKQLVNNRKLATEHILELERLLPVWQNALMH